MAYGSMLSDILCETFLKFPGKRQRDSDNPLGMLVTFRTPTHHEVEEGYRFLDLFIYAPLNYVQVWTRHRSDIILLSDMEEEDGEMVPKRGKRYKNTEEPWMLIADHDSVWRDMVRGFLQKEEKNINGFSGPSPWHHSVPPFEGIEERYEEERKRKGY